ncbi:MAG: DNA-3-methyladenine glycosylase family protein [Acidimicrobiia bacterium]
MVDPLNPRRFAQAASALVEQDPALRAIVEQFGLPPFWQRPAGFQSLVLFILEQQVSLASAAAAYRRIRERLGEVKPEVLLEASPVELRADGVSRQKDRYLRELAGAIIDHRLELDRLAPKDDDEVRRELQAIPGIGRWTADVYLLACLGRPDIWPIGDRALQVAVAEALYLDAVPNPLELEDIGNRWKPHRAVAARLLWHGYLGRRGRTETANDLF